MMPAADVDRPAALRNIAKSFAVFLIFVRFEQIMKIS